MAPEPRHTPYQLTLSALSMPLRRLLMLNAAMALSFGLIAGPLPALLWVAELSACDLVLQWFYRRLQARGAGVDSRLGLRRLAWAGFAKAVAWTSGPTLFAVLERSQRAMMFVALISIALTALAVSSVRNSSAMFLTMALTLVAGLAVCAVGVEGVGASAGLFLGMGIVVALLFQIAAGTNRTVADWNTSSERTEDAIASLAAALERSEAAERRSRIAIDLADLYVFEANYVSRVFTSAGPNAKLYDRMYGGDVFWQDPFRSVHPEDLPSVKAAWSKYLAGEGPYHLEHRARGADGRELWISTSAELLRDEAGRPRAMVGALRDVTERKLSQIALSRALEQAEAGSRAKTAFLTHMSHEVRTPLNGVLGMAQVMERDDLSAPQRARLATLRASGEDLLVLLNSILDLAAADNGTPLAADGSHETLEVRADARSLERPEDIGRDETVTALGGSSQPVPLRVLVAEDNAVNQVVLQTLLQQFGIEPVIVGDGALALAAWRDGDWDIILMDILMPHMDGIAASRAIRRDETESGRARTPIVAVTANILAHQMQAYRAAGIDEVVAKPIQVGGLIQAMERALAVSQPDEHPDATLAA